MSTVTLAFARSMASALDLTLMADGRVLSEGSVVHRLAVGPDGQLNAEAYFSFIEWGGQRQPDRLALVAQCAEAAQLDDLGTLGLALKTAPNVRDCLKRLERYFLLLTDTAVYRLHEYQDHAFFSLEQRTQNHPALSLRNECALASIMRQMRLKSARKLQFARVTFQHSCQGDAAAYEEFFKAPIEFNARKDGFEVSTESLATPTWQGDKAVSDFFTSHLDRELHQVEKAPTFRAMLLRRLSTSLTSGLPSAAKLAHDLGMSERTLFRRLADEGTTLRDVMCDA